MNYPEFNKYTSDYELDDIRISIIRKILDPIYLDIKLYIQNSFVWLTFKDLLDYLKNNLNSINLFFEDLLKCFLKLTIYLNFYIISLIVPLLICVAYLTLVERKVIGASQRRLGPNLVGLFGLGQPLADV